MRESINVDVPLKLSGIFKALELLQVGMSASSLAKLVEETLGVSSPNTRSRYRQAIFRYFVPVYNGTVGFSPLAEFFHKVHDEEARRQVILFEIVRRNLAFRRACIILRNFVDVEINKENVTKAITPLFPSEKAVNKAYEKIMGTLNQFSIFYHTNAGRRVVLREPEKRSFAYTIYAIFARLTPTPTVESILSNEYLLASFFSNVGMISCIEEGERDFWNIEKRPPINRLVLRYGGLKEFVEAL